MACRLKRLGSSWHLVPAATPSPVWVDGRPLEGARALPYDVPFQVGGYCLTLRQDQTAEPDWSLYALTGPRQISDARPASVLLDTPQAHDSDDAIVGRVSAEDEKAF